MKFLLDTHIVLWAAATPERLQTSLDELANGERLISAATAWELGIKRSIGKLDLSEEVSSWLPRAARELRAGVIDVTVAHAAAVEYLPLHHRDPFDRLLIVQARHEGAVLLTADRTLLAYGDLVRLVGA